MTADRHHPSLTVYTDESTGIRIALACGRPLSRHTQVPWRRLPTGDLNLAVDLALETARVRPAFALVLPGVDGDEAGALARCLRRAELEGFTVGREEADPAARHAAAA
ncbi:hypothetical protein [Indioceanicola profundi]|uniref:hypothetical protein n=1 Tax=Indioceanicola profundi TaxID=2220096 RepID=UPI000E6AD9CE|nr:hypothetical protein [Indioceanicola profundi]